MIYMKKGGAYHRYKKTTEKARNESTHTHTNVIMPPPPPQPPPKIGPPKISPTPPQTHPPKPTPNRPRSAAQKIRYFLRNEKGKKQQKTEEKVGKTWYAAR